MNRHASLRPLSDDHHTALVLARRLRRTPTPIAADALEALAAEVRRTFETELEPHFQVEERVLLPAMERRGAEEKVAATLDDHARLRALIREPWREDTPGALGALLEKHVRFEERVLFPEAETLLPAEELEAVRKATEATRTG